MDGHTYPPDGHFDCCDFAAVHTGLVTSVWVPSSSPVGAPVGVELL
jgi:hypothetical protein